MFHPLFFMSEKARITKVQIGSEFIDGIMLPNGDFGITVQQVVALFELSQAHGTRDLKRLLGKGSELTHIQVSESANNQEERSFN